jgi:hypothetical protein
VIMLKMIYEAHAPPAPMKALGARMRFKLLLSVARGARLLKKMGLILGDSNLESPKACARYAPCVCWWAMGDGFGRTGLSVNTVHASWLGVGLPVGEMRR